MKKTRIFLAFLLIMALFTFAGCAGNDNTLDPDTPNNNGVTDMNDNYDTNGTNNNGNNNGVNGGTTDRNSMDRTEDLTHKVTDGAMDVRDDLNQ